MAKIIKKPTVKKAQNGVAVTQDNKGVYTYTKKVNTKDGPRYYQGKSLDREMAEIKANLKHRATPADSTRRADISALKLKTMDEKKKGGVIKKMQAGGKIEEQYQKQKKVTSKQAEMDKIKTPYPKTTLKKAQNGAKVKKAQSGTKVPETKTIGKDLSISNAIRRIKKNPTDVDNIMRQAMRLMPPTQIARGVAEGITRIGGALGNKQMQKENAQRDSTYNAQKKELQKKKMGGVVKKTIKPVVKKIVKSIKKKK